MHHSVYQSFQSGSRNKKFAVLIDPDNLRPRVLDQLIPMVMEAGVDFLYVGGSLILDDDMEYCLRQLKQHTSIPLVIFPGSPMQISPTADAILLLSLISGRNPELLIGQQVVAAPYLKASGLEVISTGYMLIDGGRITTAAYMSNSLPIPRDKLEIAACTAMAGELLGLKTIYLDAGSGASHPIPEPMITAVAERIDIPLMVGGGIRTPDKAIRNLEAGADIIVVGNAIEKEPGLLFEMAQAIHGFQAENKPKSR